jgi:mono/diheme cytochrome c family protein
MTLGGKVKLLLVLLVLALVVPLGMLGYQSFQSGFSAKAEPSALEVTIARKVRLMAIPLSQRDAANPIVGSPEVLHEALTHFADHCAVCHGNDGKGKTVFGEGMYPKVPDLTKPETQDMTDGEIFFIIHNGIRFTGMPAWGKGPPEKDRDSWQLVHFIRRLPKISSQELEEMKRYNPISEMERTKDAEIEQFLSGGESGGGSGHQH